MMHVLFICMYTTCVRHYSGQSAQDLQLQIYNPANRELDLHGEVINVCVP